MPEQAFHDVEGTKKLNMEKDEQIIYYEKENE